MKRKLIVVNTLLAVLASTQIFAASPVQRIDVVNMLWNPNGTGAAPGMTPTTVVVAFSNGGAKPCFTTTLPYQGAATVTAGAGQACVARVISVALTPVAGPAGTVYAAPTAPIPIAGDHFTSQLNISNGTTDPVFDATNGTVKTPGTMKVSVQGQVALN